MKAKGENAITRRLLKPVKKPDGWWLNAASISDLPLWGPWATRDEAVEVRRSYLRNAVSKPWLRRK